MRPALHPAAALLALGVCLTTPSAHANPTNPTLVSGSATFNTVGNTLTVTNTHNTLIRWESFSIPAGSRTHFEQTAGAASTVFNRVTGASSSQIFGQLTSNGRVVLINPNGITFGAGAEINVGGLLASALHIGESDLLAGRFVFANQGGAGSVVNAGSLTSTNAAPIILIGRSVENSASGVITNNGGQVALAAGERVRLATLDNPALQVELTVSDNLIQNLGEIHANLGGRALLWGAVVRHEGYVGASPDYVVADDTGIYLKSSRRMELTEPSRMMALGGKINIDPGDGELLLDGRLILGFGRFFRPSPNSVVIVANRDSPLVSGNYVAQWADYFVGRPPPGVQAVDLPMSSELRNEFYQELLNTSATNVNTYWSRLVASPTVHPPKTFATEEEAIRYLESTPNAVGYIDSKRVTKRLKILHRL